MTTPANPLLLWRNILEVYGIASITSEAAGYAKENMYDYRLDTTWRSSGTSTQNIRINAGASLGTAVDYFAIAQGHNLGSKTATITITSTASSDYTSGATTHATINFTDNNSKIVSLASPSTNRYWQLAVSSIDSDYAEIGMMMLGPTYQFPVLPVDGFDIDSMIADGQVSIAWNNHPLGAASFNRMRRISGEFRYLSEAQAQAYQTMWSTHLHKMKPFFFVPDITNYSTRVYYMYLGENSRLALPSDGVYRHLAFEAVGPHLEDY